MAELSSCLIVGGGMAGLLAARTLEQQGHRVVVVDKGYGIGGRLASRSVKTPERAVGAFDYGCQFFSGATPQFHSWMQEWASQDLLQPWADGFPDGNGQLCSSAGAMPLAPEDRSLYRGTTSSRSIAQHLAAPLDVRNQTRIERITWQDSMWQATTTDGRAFYSHSIILTPPVPQTLELLHASELAIAPALHRALDTVRYERCIALLVLLAQECAIPKPGGVWVNSADITWMASNSQKGICPEGYGVTIHASPQFSLAQWDADKQAIVEALCAAAAPWLRTSVIAHHLHRWKYNQATHRYPDPFAVMPSPGPLLLAGDGFHSPGAVSSLEQAALSGLAAAQHLLSAL